MEYVTEGQINPYEPGRMTKSHMASWINIGSSAEKK